MGRTAQGRCVMALPLSSIRKVINLDQAIWDAEESLSTTWAVFADYHHENMTWRVGKVERWDNGRHFNSPSTHKVTNATDELDAYKKFMEQTK